MSEIKKNDMDSSFLTIFIPSYNRCESLRLTLNSIFEALEDSAYGDQIKVLVVDDYSSENIEGVIAEQIEKGRELTYRLHRQKCGVAEIAMLSCLEYIDTKFAWCIGNDDTLMKDAVDFLFPILKTTKSSFLLLNYIGIEKNSSRYECFTSNEKEIIFQNGIQLFANFGFATSTTTFPCLCFEAERLRKIDFQSHWKVSPIYSHTISLLYAFHSLQCSFIPRPIVFFNHNDGNEEEKKLGSKNQSFGFPLFYHSSLGLARHISILAIKLNIKIRDIARFHEDELNKDTKDVRTTLTGVFILCFSFSQMIYEIWSTVNQKRNTIYYTYECIDELQDFFHKSEIQELENLFKKARGIYCSDSIKPEDKIEMLSIMIEKANDHARGLITRAEALDQAIGRLDLPSGSKKALLKFDI